eukprot:7803955-Alexandrium_andersonii.AAC.1
MDSSGLEPFVKLPHPPQGPELLPETSLVVSSGFSILASIWGDAFGLSNDPDDPTPNLAALLGL